MAATKAKPETKDTKVTKKTVAKKVSTKDIKKDAKKVADSVATAAKDLRALTEAELQSALATAKADLAQAQKMLKANELPASHVIKKSKKLVARIHTVLHEVINNKETK